MEASNPVFVSVADLGLRDVGVKNDRRRIAMRVAKTSLLVVAMALLSAFALCIVVGATGAAVWVAFAFAATWTAAGFLLAFRIGKRSPPVVVKVTAEGSNHATWVAIVHFGVIAVLALITMTPLLLPMVGLGLIMAVLIWRRRDLVPAVLRRLRSLLAADEPVLGDGIGLARGVRGKDALRVVAATDRRLLVVGPTPVVDVPYGSVSGFEIEWTNWGRAGTLSLTVAGETHVIRGMAPANLLSIALALQSHRVHTDDPAVVADAQRGWEEALRRGESQGRLLDRAAMSTREFDRGLWLLLALSAVIFWAGPFGSGLWVLPIVGALCAICAYVSRTRASLAYIVPLNLLLVPTFFFTDAEGVLLLMLATSVVGAIGLWVGSALSGAARSTEPRPARGLVLIRISGVLLAAMVALVVTATAAGFELTSLRLAVDELTAEHVPADGRSNLNGNAASITYTPGPGLKEFITDEHWDAGPDDGARWELRSSFTKGQNVVSLTHYVFDAPPLDGPAAVAGFVADKDREHSRIAGHRVRHTERVVDGRKGYVWTHRNRRGYWHYAAWFPQPVHTVRLECVAKRQESRFRRLCSEAIGSLKFH